MTNPSRPKSRKMREESEHAAAPTLPQSMDAEKGLLGSFVLSPAKIEEAGALPMDLFLHPAHRLLYDAMLDLVAQRKPIDLVTLTEYVASTGKLEEVGGAAFISEVFTFVPTPANWSYYLDIAREKYLRRGIIETCERLEVSARNDHAEEAATLLDRAEADLLQLTLSAESKNAVQPIKHSARAALDEIEAAIQNKGGVTGLTTGFVDIDRMTGGLKKGEYWIIGARPSNGKTALLLNIMAAACKQVPVMFFSLEMGEVSIAKRLISSTAELNIQKIRTGFWSHKEAGKLVRATGDVAEMPIFIDATPGLTLFDFRARARQAVSKYGCGLIAVDYLGLVKSTSKRAQENRTQEVSEITRTFKTTFKELNVPGIALCQLDREAENRPPRTSDLRESSQIEQDADVIGFIHRPNKPKAGEDEDEAEANDGPEIAQFYIGKQRDGPVGAVNLEFQKEYSRFVSTTQKLFSNNPNQRQKKKP